jgi:hypothetical protein
MSVGGYDYHRHRLNATTFTVPYNDKNGLYSIQLNKVRIGDTELNVTTEVYNKGEGSFIDSGTTLVYADKIIYDEFMK